VRKKELREYFKEKVRFFITEVMQQKKATAEEKKLLREEVALTLIDFSLEVGIEDFLFTDAINCMAAIDAKDIFLNSLEPFIRLNRVHYFPSFDALKNVI
jgi:hypothetical protein